MPRKRKPLSFYLRQNNTRGMGLARDVKAGQASPVEAINPTYRRRAKRPPVSGRRTSGR